MEDIFSKIIAKLTDGLSITFTKDNVAEGDTWLNLRTYPQIVATFHKDNWGVWSVDFDGYEERLLEKIPDSFLRSIYKNLN